MLLHRGLIPETAAFRASSRSRHIRNGVCVPRKDEAAFVISEDAVTFREFALYFRDRARLQRSVVPGRGNFQPVRGATEASGRAREAGADDRGGRVAGYFFFLARLKITFPS